MKNVPNIVTLFNLLFGCCAIVFAMKTDISYVKQQDGGVPAVIPTCALCSAAICIGIASFMDFLDGFLARLLHATGEMGKQLDSLSDIVSFGVAPAVILFQLLRLSYMGKYHNEQIPFVLLLPAFLFVAAGAYRLARFNIDVTQQGWFKGVPIPAAALVVASFPIIGFNNYCDGVINEIIFNKWFLYAATGILSYLMISTIPIMTFKFKEYSFHENLPKIILMAMTLVAAIVFKWMAVPVIFLVYIFLSLTLSTANELLEK